MASATIIVDAGVYTWTGADVTFRFSMPVDAGGYALTGQVAGSIEGFGFMASPGAYALSGSSIFFASPRFIKSETLLEASAERFVKGDSALLRNVLSFVKGDTVFVTHSRFIKGDAALLVEAMRFIRGDAEFVSFRRFVKGDAALMTNPPLQELGPSPAATATGFLSRHWLSIASIKKEESL